MGFECERCGECCRHVGQALKYLPTHFVVIFNPDENGVCCHLKENLCDIYEDRPLICNVEWMAKNKAKHMGISEEMYYKIAKDGCKRLQEIGGKKWNQ